MGGTRIAWPGALAQAVLLAALLLTLLPKPAPAAGPTVVSPREGARVGGSTMVVRVRASGSHFTALLNGRDVSRRFGRSRAGVRTARFRRGRDYRLGHGEILVATGKRFTRRRRTDSASFVALRRGAGGVRIERRRRAALHVSVSGAGRVRATRVWLNGRRVETRLRRRRDARGVVGPLGADDGLRFGVNRVTAEIERANGTVARRTRRFRVRRRAPLVGAGRHHRTRPRRAVTLDGSATRAPRRGSRVRYRWRIVAAPRGSRARLRRATAKRARLVPDRPGRYRIALTARAVRPRGATAAARSASATDEAEVVVPPTLSPMGVPVQTVTSSSVNGGGGIQVGDQNYAYNTGWVKLLVLDEETLQPVSGPWGAGHQGFDVNQGAQLVAAIRATTANQLVILSGQGNRVGGALDGGSLAQAFELLGGIADRGGATPNGTGDLANGAWSLIGHNGLAPGQAHQSVNVVPAPIPGFVGGAPGQPGSLTGYLQPVSSNAFQFVSPEGVPLDTAASGTSETQSVISVGSQTYTSDQIPSGALGFHLVVLDRSAGLARRDHHTYVANNPDGSTNVDPNTGVQGLVAALDYWNAVGDQPLIVLQSFGTATYWGTAPNSRYWIKDRLPSFGGNLDWFGGAIATDRGSLQEMWGGDSVAGMLGAMGGQHAHDVVANFGKNYRHMGGLSFVAATHLYDQGDATVLGQTDPVPSQARVIGTLSRNNQSQWTLRAPANDPRFDPSALWQLAFRQPTDWPLTGTPSLDNANAYIAGSLFSGSGETDVREAYVNQADAPWGDKKDDLAGITYPSNANFSEDDFNALKAQLHTEMGYVVDVRTAIEGWQKVFGTTALTSWVDLQTLADQIVDQALTANSQRGKSTSLDTLEVVSGALFVGQAMLGFGGEFTGWAAVPVGAVAASLGLADALTPHPDGSVQDDTQEIWDQAYRLGQDMVDRHVAMSTTLDHLGDLFVSDWGRLQAAEQASGGWFIGTRTQNALTQAMSVTGKRTFVQSLMPLAYNQWVISPRFTSINQQGVPDPPRGYQCYHATDTNYDGFENPYVSDPAGNLQAIQYRVSADDDPANQYTSIHTGRVLRNNQNDTVLQKTYEGSGYGETVNMRRDGSPPPAGFINPLFQQVTPNDPLTNPTSLGMTPEQLFGSGRWTLRKLQCGGNWSP
jgi:hypothetical protein